MEHSPDTSVNRSHHPVAVFLRGMAMGAADIVPGVSGGTIAFITGIYFRLLDAISAAPVAFVRQFLKGNLRGFWQSIDGTFLLTLLAGVVASVASLASLITWLLDSHPIMIWSFFFGLIVASVWHVGRQARQFSPWLLLPLCAGIAFAWWITALPASEVAPTQLAFFGAGALAICAMILPGISGSFLLVLIGMYSPVLAAIKSFEVAHLGLFLLGCLTGLLSVARLITLAFRHFHDTVLALLTGFMIGALGKVWPWQETLSWRTNSKGDQVPLSQAPVTPDSWAALTGQDPQVMVAVLMALAGLVLVLGLEFIGKVSARTQNSGGQ
jgi:putative membrane protein